MSSLTKKFFLFNFLTSVLTVVVFVLAFNFTLNHFDLGEDILTLPGAVTASASQVLVGLLSTQLITLIIWVILLITARPVKEYQLRLFTSLAAINAAIIIGIGEVLLSLSLMNEVKILLFLLLIFLGLILFIFGGVYVWDDNDYSGLKTSAIVYKLLANVVFVWVGVYLYLLIVN